MQHTFKVTNDKDQSVQIAVDIDFSDATDEQKEGWALSNRIIALQRVLRPLSVEEIKALNGTKFMSTQCGKKVKSREEQVRDIKAKFGVSQKIAEWAVDNPDEFQEKINELFGDVE